MFHKMSFVLAITALALSSRVLRAERVPEEPQIASHVVTGIVQRVFTREMNERMEYIVEIKLAEVERPASAKSGDLLWIYCFQAKKIRRNESPSELAKTEAILAQIGEAGHDAIPKEGQRIRALAKPRNGRLEGLYPKWFSQTKADPKNGTDVHTKRKELGANRL